MPEGGTPQAKRHRHPIRLHLCRLLQVDVEKPEQGVGGHTLAACEHTDAVKRPVQDAVTVNCQQSHRLFLHRFFYYLYL